MTQYKPGRRAALMGAAGAVGSFAIGGRAFGQGAPVVFGALPPLTGAGGPYGPAMLRAIQQVIDEANAVGGIRGRQIRVVAEDDQTNPDAGVRGARREIRRPQSVHQHNDRSLTRGEPT